MCSKIALFGGTFDPVHLGHIQMAEYIHTQLGFERVIFLPNGNPPHKPQNPIVDVSHRINMLHIATRGKEYFEVCDYEAKRQTPSYSVDTLRVFRQQYGDNLHFVIGADSLRDIATWRSWQELLKENKFVVFKRYTPDFDGDFTRYAPLTRGMILADMPEVSVSSTEVRRLIKCKEDISALVGDEVAQYIGANRLYGDYDDDRTDKNRA